MEKPLHDVTNSMKDPWLTMLKWFEGIWLMPGLPCYYIFSTLPQEWKARYSFDQRFNHKFNTAVIKWLTEKNTTKQKTGLQVKSMLELIFLYFTFARLEMHFWVQRSNWILQSIENSSDCKPSWEVMLPTHTHKLIQSCKALQKTNKQTSQN